MTVEKFLADGYLFVDGDSYTAVFGDVFVVGKDINSECASTHRKGNDERFVLSAKCLEEKEMKKEEVKIENPDIFALKGDFEMGKLYRSTYHGFKQICTVSELGSYCQIGDIYRKQHWTDKLDGTEENGVWCEVWDANQDKFSISLEFITNFVKGDYYPYKGNDTYKNAEPVPQAMVDFINRK